MQKISSYLYSNRILVVADLASYPVEWTPVYQRTIKMYKGMKNVIEFDIRNADQKRISVNGYTIKCLIMDVFNTEVLTADVTPIAGKVGLATATITAIEIDYIKPQFLKYTLYILNDDGSKTPLYGDTQFGIGGNIDLLSGAVPELREPQIIDTFNYMQPGTLLNPALHDRVYTSDAVEVNPRNDINDQHAISLEFRLTNFSASVTVQITTDVVVSTSTTWINLETFQISNTTDLINKVYREIDDYSNNIGWLRISYVLDDSNTGKLDKVLVIS